MTKNYGIATTLFRRHRIAVRFSRRLSGFLLWLCFSLSIFVISVSFLRDISLSSVNKYIISASSNCSDVIMTFLQITSLMSYGSMIQCQKIYILCFISTKYISFVTEYIVSMAVHCSDVDLIQCQKIYTLCFVSNTSYLWQCNAAILI